MGTERKEGNEHTDHGVRYQIDKDTKGKGAYRCYPSRKIGKCVDHKGDEHRLVWLESRWCAKGIKRGGRPGDTVSLK